MNTITRNGLVALLFGVAGYVHAACPLPMESNAISVQNNAGQGGFTCQDLSANGIALVDLSAHLALNGSGPIAKVECSDGSTPNNGQCKSGQTLNWYINEGAAAADEYYQVFLVSAVNGGAGSACNYLYAAGESVQSGNFLGDVTLGKAQTQDTLVCGDPVAKIRTEPREVTVIDTALGACDTKIEAGDDLLATQQATFGYALNEDGSRTFSACGNTEDAGGLSADRSTGQVRCIPPEYVAQVPSNDQALCTPSVDGELPLECAPVNVNAAPADGPEYCWFYENKVCRGGLDDPAYCDGRTAGTYIIQNLKDSVNAQFNVFEGSTCITQIFYGIAYHTCW